MLRSAQLTSSSIESSPTGLANALPFAVHAIASHEGDEAIVYRDEIGVVTHLG